MTENENFYSQDNQITAGWMSFKNVWDSVKGTFVEKFNKEGSGQLPDQVVFTLTNATLDSLSVDAEWNILWVEWSEKVEWEINVWVKASNTYILQRLKNIEAWDIIWFAFTKEIPPKQKWYSPAKSIQPFKAGKDITYLNNQINKTSNNDLLEWTGWE